MSEKNQIVVSFYFSKIYGKLFTNFLFYAIIKKKLKPVHIEIVYGIFYVDRFLYLQNGSGMFIKNSKLFPHILSIKYVILLEGRLYCGIGY